MKLLAAASNDLASAELGSGDASLKPHATADQALSASAHGANDPLSR